MDMEEVITSLKLCYHVESIGTTETMIDTSLNNTSEIRKSMISLVRERFPGFRYSSSEWYDNSAHCTFDNGNGEGFIISVEGEKIVWEVYNLQTSDVMMTTFTYSEGEE